MTTPDFYNAVFSAIAHETVKPQLGSVYAGWLIKDVRRDPDYYAGFVGSHPPDLWETTLTTGLPEAHTPAASAFLYSLFLASYPRLIAIQQREAARLAKVPTHTIHYTNPNPLQRGKAPLWSDN